MFPRLKVVGDVAMADGGATLRDHFAATAPDMPSWFHCAPSRPRPVAPSPDDHLSDEKRKEYRRAMNERWDDEDISPEVLEFMSKVDEASAEIDKWAQEQRSHKFIAWRWHYADLMIAARGAA